MPINWPSREEWARRQRTPYFDELGEHRYRPSKKLSLYASTDEAVAAMRALRGIWSDLGRRMETAKRRAGPLARRSGETNRQWSSRYFDMTDDEAELALAVEQFRYKRQEINAVIKQLYNGVVPWWRPSFMTPPAPLDAILARYDAAVKAGDEKWIAEVQSRPIDDDAWAKELEHRRRINESYFLK